jgi:predicted acylesterase/phospholipase RssA
MRPAFREYRRRARILPGLLARSAWRYFTRPFSAGSLEAFAALGRAIPTGIFDNEAIHEYLEEVFAQPGQTNDFRRLRRRLFLVATDLDSGGVVSFGRPGRDDVPISKAVQASSALPGLFPPVEIDGHHFVDGALKKTLHASEALDAGARLVICINPIVPFDARLEASRRGTARSRLVEGGLPVVLSQTFRAVIHSRMAVGMSKYESQYRDADVVLFQPDPDDSTIFFTNIFSYATRRQVCEHAYQRTRADLLQRRGELQPILARHGIRMRLDRLAEPRRRLEARVRSRPGTRLTAVAGNLRDTLRELRRAI